MSASDALPGQQLNPLSSTDGVGEYTTIPAHLNAAFSAEPHGLPDSTADHPLPTNLGGGPDPGVVSATGADPGVTAPVG